MEKLKHTKSEELYAESLKLVPGGILGIRKPHNFIPGEFPIFLDSAKGGHVTDVDGNEYIDMLCAYGPIILGHREEELDNAVAEQMKNGFCMNLTQRYQNELARKMIEIIPCAEMVFFVKTGSDATTSAIRIARAHTEKPKILQCGYHGWHDWCSPVKSGILDKAWEDTHPFAYNDIDSLEKLINQYKGEVAAVIITPLGHELNHPIEEPKPGFLEEVKKMAHDNDALLIYDEVRTGFRVTMGGAQQHYGVTPDISVFGKAMANGYPIAAVVGKKDVMMTLEDKHVFISSTFFPNSIEQVAALKTIEILEREKALDAIWAKGKTLMKGIAEAIEKTGVNAQLSGIPPMPFVTFPKDDKKLYKTRRTRFYTETIRRGLFVQPFHHGYIAFRHTDEDIQKAIGIMTEALEVVAKEIH